MTCKEAIEQLNEFLDNEIDDANYSKIRQHIDMCHKFCEKFEFEQSIKKVIRERTQLHKTPQHVLQSIVSQWAELNEERSKPESIAVEPEVTDRKSIFDFFTLRPA